MEILDLAIKIAEILEKLKIKYCVTGGFAVSVWGRLRSTCDIDLIIQIEEDKIRPFIKEIANLSRAGYLDEAAVRDAVARGAEFNYIHSDSGIKIDFWVIKKSDAVGKNEFTRRKLKKIDGQKVYFISPEDLILSKLRWHKDSRSTRHLEDIESVLKFSKINKNYLLTQAKRQSILQSLKKVLK